MIKKVFVAKRNFKLLWGAKSYKEKLVRKSKRHDENKLPTNKEFIEEFVKAIEDYK